MKPVVEGLHADGLVDVIAGWEFWVWAIAGIVGFFVQQLSLATGGSSSSVATVSVANPVVRTSCFGALVLQEAARQHPPWHAVVAVGALCLALLGAVVISSARAAERGRAGSSGSRPALRSAVARLKARGRGWCDPGDAPRRAT
jgi:hypothetical protein